VGEGSVCSRPFLLAITLRGARPLRIGRFLQNTGFSLNDSKTLIPEGLAEKVRSIVEDVIANTTLFVVDVVVRGQKGSRVIEVYLDSDDSLDIDRLASVSREVGFLLDLGEVIQGKYHLNVSSPGLDRPLQMPRQYLKNIGRKLTVRFREGDQVLSLDGELKNASDEAIELVGQKESRSIPFGEIVEARVQLPW